MSRMNRNLSSCVVFSAVGILACESSEPPHGTPATTDVSSAAGGNSSKTSVKQSSAVGGASLITSAVTGGAPATSVTAGGATVITTGSTGGATVTTIVATGGAPQQPGQTVTASELVPVALQQSLTQAKAMDQAALLEAYPAPTTAISYDASTAKGMDLVQASRLALNDNEKDLLAANGLVISSRQQFASFAHGYKTIYAEDLPVYVSADSILEAAHRTFDSLLKQTEELALINELTQLLDGLRTKLAESNMDRAVAKDADLYLTVAASLLAKQTLAPVAGADSTQAAALLKCATAAEGHETVTLFGVEREEDCSQFAPRGHYTDSTLLERYFKAMMWLGRVDLRLVETQGDGTQVFHRRQFDAAVALRELMDDASLKLWEHIDATIGAYVGEHDSMTPKDLDGLMKTLGVTSLSDSARLTDQEIIDELARGGWGAQRIASRIIIKDVDGPTLPLDRSFLLFGQRFTVDSLTFVNVTHDRVENRMMPKPLDAAFAALGNDAALPLLSSEFTNAAYVQGLAKTRALVDAHESSYWEGSIYTRWLGSLRSLSPTNDNTLPSVTKTSAWQNRILSTQLGSWAELRHDTILYAKQSYSVGVSCEFPDAYVDPYPEFYAKLGTLADAVGVVASTLPTSAATLKTKTEAWVAGFKVVTNNLQKMAENQRAGTAHSAELLAFINDAVKWDEQSMCGGAVYSNLSGWYLKLYLDQNAGLEYDRVVADVHTQATDEGGADVGRVLHVGTGSPRLMIVTADTCQGPRAYAGLAFAYGEFVTENWKRLNDNEWKTKLSKEAFPEPTWMSNVT